MDFALPLRSNPTLPLTLAKQRVQPGLYMKLPGGILGGVGRS